MGARRRMATRGRRTAWLNSGELLDRMNFSMALADNNAGTVMGWDKLLGPDARRP